MTNGIVSFICSTSAISALLAALRIPACLLSCITRRMAKRMQEQSDENRMVAKSKPMVMNLTNSVAASNSSMDSPIASRSQGIPKSTGWIFREV